MEHGFRKKNLQCISLEFTTGNLVKNEKNEMRKEKESSLFNEYFFVTESFLHIGHIYK